MDKRDSDLLKCIDCFWYEPDPIRSDSEPQKGSCYFNPPTMNERPRVYEDERCEKYQETVNG